MLAILAAVLFFIAFIVHVADTATNAVFSSQSLLLLGLVSLALHLAGIGAGWAPRGGWRR